MIHISSTNNLQLWPQNCSCSPDVVNLLSLNVVRFFRFQVNSGHRAWYRKTDGQTRPMNWV